jgi:hypothetical protein
MKASEFQRRLTGQGIQTLHWRSPKRPERDSQPLVMDGIEHLEIGPPCAAIYYAAVVQLRTHEGTIVVIEFVDQRPSWSS